MQHSYIIELLFVAFSIITNLMKVIFSNNDNDDDDNNNSNTNSYLFLSTNKVLVFYQILYPLFPSIFSEQVENCKNFQSHRYLNDRGRIWTKICLQSQYLFLAWLKFPSVHMEEIISPFILYLPIWWLTGMAK